MEHSSLILLLSNKPNSLEMQLSKHCIKKKKKKKATPACTVVRAPGQAAIFVRLCPSSVPLPHAPNKSQAFLHYNFVCRLLPETQRTVQSERVSASSALAALSSTGCEMGTPGGGLQSGIPVRSSSSCLLYVAKYISCPNQLSYLICSLTVLTSL